jgi:uncharacterized protein DUF1998
VSTKAKRTRVGSLRPSALIHSFGIGSVVDLPRLSTMVMGLDDWRLDHAPVIEEPRLLAQVRQEEGLGAVERFHGPPQTEDIGGLSFAALDAARLVGVPVAPFPRWLLCPVCRKLAPVESGLFELKVDPFRPDRNRYVHTNCQNAKTAPSALPARFVVACEDGHLDDFPWVAFTHRKQTVAEVECPWNLRLDEIGASGEVADIQVRCVTCDQARRLSEAFGEKNRLNMPTCTGAHPHLRERNGCPRRMRAMLLGASNSWFAVSRSALSLPRHVDPLAQQVEGHWTTLQHVKQVSELELLRSIGQLEAFKGIDDDKLFATIEAHRAASETEEEVADLKLPEWKLLTTAKPPSSPDFTARGVEPPTRYGEAVERVVLVDRLREVQALLGFTRIESPFDETGKERRVPLARGAPTYLPAAEVHGEGVFLQFREEAVERWCRERGERDGAFFAAHVAWRSRRKIENPDAGFPTIRYVLLHTFAHALMRQFALECGYSHASIRERIYALPPEAEGGPMAGVLLYTAAPDSEGTLGGLVALGQPDELERHLERALAHAGLCASDPLCAEHEPDPEGMTLHAAACHACLFAPETSCERGNRYLDRAVLAELVSGMSIAFFPTVGER